MKTIDLKQTDTLRRGDRFFGWHRIPKSWIGKKATPSLASFFTRCVPDRKPSK